MKLSIAVSPKRRKFAAVPIQGEIESALSLVREIGYDGIELNMGHPNEVDAAKLKDGLKRHALTAVSIATGAAYIEENLCLTADQPLDRQKAIDRIRLQCEFGASIGAMVVVGMMRGRLDVDADKAKRQREWFAESLQSCAAGARDTGAQLIVEPMNRYETNFLRTVRETIDFLDAAGRSEIMLMPDTFHMNIEESDIEAAFVLARKRIGLVQTVDSNRRAPGMGHIDFASIVAVLAAIGYEGFLSAEVLAEPDGTTAGRGAYSHLNSILERLDCKAN